MTGIDHSPGGSYRHSLRFQRRPADHCTLPGMEWESNTTPILSQHHHESPPHIKHPVAVVLCTTKPASTPRFSNFSCSCSCSPETFISISQSASLSASVTLPTSASSPTIHRSSLPAHRSSFIVLPDKTSYLLLRYVTT